MSYSLNRNLYSGSAVIGSIIFPARVNDSTEGARGHEALAVVSHLAKSSFEFFATHEAPLICAL
jgi:hypothetical protein